MCPHVFVKPMQSLVLMYTLVCVRPPTRACSTHLFKFLLFLRFKNLCVCAYVSVSAAHASRCPRGPEESIRVSGTGVIGRCEPTTLYAGN